MPHKDRIHLNAFIPHVRGILILLHIVAISLKALPAPEGGLNKKSWKDPTVQAEIAHWNQNLQNVGWTGTPKELEEELWKLARNIMDVRQEVLKPFQWYYRNFGADQSWRLFVAPHMFPSKLHVDIYVNETWLSLYEPFTEYRWNHELFENPRFRPAMFRFAWTTYRNHYLEFASFIAKQAALEFPEASKIRMRWWKQRSPSPEEIQSQQLPEGAYHSLILLDLNEIRETRP